MYRSPSFSLLWPGETRLSPAYGVLDAQCVRDLGLEGILTAFIGSTPSRSIREVYLTLCTDPAIIAYRQDIVADLWHNPTFTTRLEALLPDISGLEISPYRC